jgi:alginate O-acetyltransferase complex protein AlgJ
MKRFLFFLFTALTSSPALEIDAVLKEHLEAAQSSSVEGAEGWRYLPAEIKHLLAGDPSKDPKNPLAAITDFNEQLKRLGIRLIVIPVPAKAAVHPEFLDLRLKGASIPMSEAGFYDTLRSNGV